MIASIGEKYVDGEREPFLQVRTGDAGSHAIVTSRYTRRYNNGATAKRIVCQVWDKGKVLHATSDIDFRSLEKMYPIILVHNQAPEPDAATTAAFGL